MEKKDQAVRKLARKTTIVHRSDRNPMLLFSEAYGLQSKPHVFGLSSLLVLDIGFNLSCKTLLVGNNAKRLSTQCRSEDEKKPKAGPKFCRRLEREENLEVYYRVSIYIFIWQT